MDKTIPRTIGKNVDGLNKYKFTESTDLSDKVQFYIHNHIMLVYILCFLGKEQVSKTWKLKKLEAVEGSRRHRWGNFSPRTSGKSRKEALRPASTFPFCLPPFKKRFAALKLIEHLFILLENFPALLYIENHSPPLNNHNTIIYKIYIIYFSGNEADLIARV